jgi:predicted RNase H-like HicB family nuclease
MTERAFEVRAEWDADASVWIATSDDVPGLCCEAATFEELLAELEPLVPELLLANGVLPQAEEVPLRVIIDRRAGPRAAA